MRTVFGIARKELTIYFATPVAYAVCALFTVIASVFFWWFLQRFMVHSHLFLQTQRPELLDNLNFNDQVITPIYVGFVQVIFLFVLPLLTMRLLAGEKRNQTMELLLSSPVTPLQIVLGKYLASLVMVLILSSICVVYPLLLQIFGDGVGDAGPLDWPTVWLGVLGLVLVGATCAAVGLFTSSITNNQIVAAVVALMLLMFLWVLRGIGASLQGQLGEVLSYLSLLTHIQYFARGVVRVADLTYFASAILFFLFLSHRFVEGQRWGGALEASGLRPLAVAFGSIGGVVLVTCLLTVFFFSVDSLLLWGKVVLGCVLIGVALVLSWRRLIAAFGNRSAAYSGISVVLTVALAVALVAVNVLALQHKTEYDITKNRVHTLAEQSQQLLQQLQQEIEIIAFFRQTELEAQAIKDLVHRYQIHSPKITLRVVDPDTNPDLVEKFHIKTDSPRVVVASPQRETRIRGVGESDLTNALIEITQSARQRVYFLLGHGEASIDDKAEPGYQSTAQDLRSQGYEVMSLNLVEVGKVPADSGLIVIAGPTSPLLEPELVQLAEYLDRGGKLMVLLEPNSDPGLETFLATYQLGYNNDTIIDVSQYGRLFGMGPDAAIVFSYQDHPITRQLENTMSIFPGARSLKTVAVGDNVDPAVTSQVVFATTPRSWGETNITAGDWEWNEGEVKGPVTLAAAATKNTSTVDQSLRLGSEMRVLLLGDSSFADNRFRSLQVNRDLFLNMVAWLTEQEKGITIRPRLRGASRIILSSEQEAFIAFFALDVMPVSLVALGFAVWAVRRRR